MTIAPALYQACQVSFFVCGLMVLSVAVYLFADWYTHPPLSAHGVFVPVSSSPYIVSPSPRLRRTGIYVHGRWQNPALRTRQVRRYARLRLSNGTMRGIAV